MSRQASPQKINKLANNREANQQTKLSGSALAELEQQHLLAQKILSSAYGGDGHLKASWDKSI